MIDRFPDCDEFDCEKHRIKLNEVIDVVNKNTLLREKTIEVNQRNFEKAIGELTEYAHSHAGIHMEGTTLVSENIVKWQGVQEQNTCPECGGKGDSPIYDYYKFCWKACPTCNSTGKKPLDKRITEEVAMERALANEKDLQKTYSAVKNCCWVCAHFEASFGSAGGIQCEKEYMFVSVDVAWATMCNGKDFQLKKELAG